MYKLYKYFEEKKERENTTKSVLVFIGYQPVIMEQVKV